jgi:hypothetical protein
MRDFYTQYYERNKFLEGLFMITLLLSTLLALIVIIGVTAMILIIFGLVASAVIAIKILMAMGLIYLGVKVLKSLF